MPAALAPDNRSTDAPSAGEAPVSLFVVIPAYNEAASIGAVLDALGSSLPGVQVVVVDDGSTDSTVSIARERRAIVLPLANHLGAWGATQAGIRFALRQGGDTVVTMDADGQHRAADIPKLLEPLASGCADVAIGTFTARGSPMRQVAWRLLRASSGIRLEDLTSGFRAYNRSACSALAGWRASLLNYQDIGVLTLLLGEGLRVVDVDVQMEPRHSGHSRVFHTWPSVAYYMVHTLLLGLSKRRLRSYRGAGRIAVDRP
ncbi:MAG: glycosyltransferase involved in cell wall biosynthesis [Halieaceae bacterium]|jgi:glycosyltransferase involved in cell wall biosynthesis